MQLTAIVPATDRPPELERCLAAIRGAEDPPEELIVVDTATRRGPAAARNEGAARAAGDVLVFVDADVLPRTDAFRRIREAFASDPSLAAVFGSYDDSPEAAGVVSGFRNLLHHFVHQQSAGPATTFWAGLGAMRRDAFTRAGGFDEKRYSEPSIEDIELGMRLTAAGARMRLDPALQGKHLKRWTLSKMIRTDFRDRGVPWVALLAGYGATPTGLNLGWRHRASAVTSVSRSRRRSKGTRSRNDEIGQEVRPLAFPEDVARAVDREHGRLAVRIPVRMSTGPRRPHSCSQATTSSSSSSAALLKPGIPGAARSRRFATGSATAARRRPSARRSAGMYPRSAILPQPISPSRTSATPADTHSWLATRPAGRSA